MLSQALMCIRDAVYVVGSDRRILFANSAFVEKYGCENPVGELVGDVYEELSPPYAPGDELGIGVSSYESVEHATRSGVRSHVLKSSSSVLDSQGKEIGQVVVIRDISEIVRTSELLREYATIDDMTQTMSRPFGRMLLEKQMALALRSGQPLTVCYVDIDDLKIVNDTFGHGEGDSYITLVTQALTGATRLSDSVCRLGGDEFLMILPECSLDEARTMWGRVLMTFEAANKSGSKPYLISVSHGFAQFDHTAHPTPDQLISQADASMYADKLSKSAMNPKPRGPGDSDGPSA
jgi:diguanylate cyclase (GGDEF)-like protein